MTIETLGEVAIALFCALGEGLSEAGFARASAALGDILGDVADPDARTVLSAVAYDGEVSLGDTLPWHEALGSAVLQ
jgi:hypothetical protein